MSEYVQKVRRYKPLWNRTRIEPWWMKGETLQLPPSPRLDTLLNFYLLFHALKTFICPLPAYFFKANTSQQRLSYRPLFSPTTFDFFCSQGLFVMNNMACELVTRVLNKEPFFSHNTISVKKPRTPKNRCFHLVCAVGGVGLLAYVNNLPA